MSLNKAYSFVVVGLLIATTASADVIPFFGRRSPPMRSYLELRVVQVPKGIVFIFIDERGRFRDKSQNYMLQNHRMIIDEPGTIYGAYEYQLSNPFSVYADRDKLIELRTIRDREIPHSDGVPPQPAVLICTMTKDKSMKYVLKCPE